MKERLEAIREQAIAKIKDAKDISVLNDVRVEILGKKGQLTEVLKGMKDVAPEDRPKVGQLVNDTRKRIEEELENVKKDLEAKAREAKLKAEVIDVLKEGCDLVIIEREDCSEEFFEVEVPSKNNLHGFCMKQFVRIEQ